MTPLTHLPDVLTVEEAGEVLRIGRGAAYEAVRRGTLPAVRIGRTIRVPRRALETILGQDEAPAGNGRQVTTSAAAGDGHGGS